jgi:hypothetical protein
MERLALRVVAQAEVAVRCMTHDQKVSLADEIYLSVRPSHLDGRFDPLPIALA